MCGESPNFASAARRPLALLTPEGNTITAPLLKMICSSSDMSRIDFQRHRFVGHAGRQNPLTHFAHRRRRARASFSTNSRGSASASSCSRARVGVVQERAVFSDDQIAQTDLRKGV